MPAAAALGATAAVEAVAAAAQGVEPADAVQTAVAGSCYHRPGFVGRPADGRPAVAWCLACRPRFRWCNA